MEDSSKHEFPFFKNVRREHILYSLSMIFVLLTLLLLYKVPFNGDDAINCTTGGALTYLDRSLWDHTQQILKSWLDTGRFYPLAFYSYTVFTVLPTLAAYRTFQICLNLIVIASFGVLTYRLTKSSQAAAAAILIIPVFIQYRYYQDPMLAYHGMLQFVALFLIWAMFFQIYGIEKKKVLPILFSSILFVCSLLIYEISFSFIAVFLLIAVHYGKGKMRIVYFLPHLIVTAVILGITLYLRANAASAGYSGTQISFDIGKIAKAFISQTTSAIPLSYWILAQPTFLFHSAGQFFAAVKAWDVLLAVIFGVLLMFVFFLLPRKKSPRSLILYGLALWLLPATIISLSERYQIELSPGVGYLPIYIQYFGGVLIAICVIQFIFVRVKKEAVIRILAVIFVVCFSFGFLINTTNNRQIKNVFADNNNQALSSKAMQDGILNSLENNDSLLVLGGGYGLSYNPACFVCLYANGLRVSNQTLDALIAAQNISADDVDLNIQSLSAEKETSEQTNELSSTMVTLTPENLYVYQCIGDLECGFAELGKVVSIVYDSADMTIKEVNVSEMTIYVCDEGQGRLHIEQQNEDIVSGTDILLADIFAEPAALSKLLLSDGQNTAADVDVTRITSVEELTGLAKVYQLDQNKMCTLTIQSSEGTFLFSRTGVFD